MGYRVRPRHTGMETRLWTVLSTLLAGVLIGAVVMLFVTPPVSGTSVPSHSMATATGCLDADHPRGWIGMVPDADNRAVYLTNYSHVHTAPDVEIRGSLSESTTNAWVFAITVMPESSERATPETCQPRSMIDVAIALPTSAESLTISVEGETVAVVQTTANSPRFFYTDG